MKEEAGSLLRKKRRGNKYKYKFQSEINTQFKMLTLYITEQGFSRLTKIALDKLVLIIKKYV